FCNRKTDVDIVAKSLKKYGYNAEPIHGDLDQSRRMEVLGGFRDGTIRFLCASDVAARGLDIPNVSHVFNFDVPGHAEDYVHRIGRTGRAGRKGKALMICEPRDQKNLDAVERLIEKVIPRVDGPQVATSDEDTSEADARPSDERRSSRGRGRGKPGAAETRATEPKAAEPRAAEPVRRDDRAEDRPAPRSRSSRGGRSSRSEDVVGMGDHMPQFIAQSFEERRD
ncbi:MAG: C-terminal helicase domain-containing protein, partial [Maritimibacter sp.]|nr:C-terminal helicase domain-containing protein [Maritimibacter sp.]